MRPPELLQAVHVWLRRAHLTDAVDLLASYASDPSATRYLSWPTRRTVREVQDWLVPHVAGWEVDGSTGGSSPTIRRAAPSGPSACNEPIRGSTSDTHSRGLVPAKG